MVQLGAAPQHDYLGPFPVGAKEAVGLGGGAVQQPPLDAGRRFPQNFLALVLAAAHHQHFGQAGRPQRLGHAPQRAGVGRTLADGAGRLFHQQRRAVIGRAGRRRAVIRRTGGRRGAAGLPPAVAVAAVP